MENNSSVITSISLVAILVGLSGLVLTYIVYLPGLTGPFLLDDQKNIVENEKLRIEHLTIAALTTAALSSDSGFLKRPISMLTFALNHAATGLNPYYFKITNVAIHAFNGIALYFFLALFFEANRSKIPNTITNHALATLSVLIAASWLLHPINLTSILYIVQRMTSLAAFFGLWSLVFYLWGRINQVNGRSGGLQLFIGIFLLMPLAVFSKENAVLVPLFCLLMEWLCFRFRLANGQFAWSLLLFYMFCVIIPLVIFVFVLFTGSHYRHQEFTPWERLLTESRVIWFYLRLILLPQLADMSLYHDDFVLSKTIFDPLSTLFATLGILGLFGSAVGLRTRAPIYAFGILFFLLAHASESTIANLELMHEHRNYLPSLGILLIVFYYLLCSLHIRRFLLIRRILAILFVIGSTGTTLTRASIWGSEGSFSIYSVTNRPNSPRAHYYAGAYYLRVMRAQPDKQDYYYDLATKHLLQVHKVASANSAGLMSLLLVEHRHRSQWFKQLKQRLSSHKLTYITAAIFHELGECAKIPECPVSKLEMRELLTAAIRNPQQKPIYKSRLLHKAGLFAYLRGEIDQAIDFAEQSIATDPSWPDTWRSLILMLIQVGRIQEAEQRILALQQSPVFNELKLEIPDFKAAVKDYSKERRESKKR